VRCLTAIAFVVAFWIAVALFAASALAAPRREAEFPARPSPGASHSGVTQIVEHRLKSEVTESLPVSGMRRTLPSVASRAQPTNAPANVSATGSISGQATWYRYHPGQVAAGPALRAWLGKGWRGTTVMVCAKTCISTRLTDWCLCRGKRIVDLDSRSFRALAPLSQGVVRVTVSRLPVGPATDTVYAAVGRSAKPGPGFVRWSVR